MGERPAENSASASFHVRQIYFRPDQLSGLDPAFTPFDNGASPAPDEHEFYVFRTEYARGAIAREGHTGYLSWKFAEKTGLTGDEFLRFCRENPGHDVYFVNPFPMEIFLGNVWQQGEARHPGLLGLSQHIFDAVYPSINLERLPRSLRTTSFCNFWVGNARFWDAYMDFCLPIYEYVKNGMTPDRRRLFESNADPFRHASHFAFVFERLLTTFLATRPEFTFKSYEYSPAQLRRKYPPDGAAILEALQDLERAQPDAPEPLLKSPALLAAFNLYYMASEQSFTPFGRKVYMGLRRIARALPGRQRLVQSPIYQAAVRRILRVVRPHAVSLTQPPKG